ncbi:MAG: PH domain-containing protein [Thermofilaceae archaeon]
MEPEAAEGVNAWFPRPNVVQVGSAAVLRVKPSVAGFARKYALALTPVYTLLLSGWLAEFIASRVAAVPRLLPGALAPLLAFAAFVVGWVLRSPEAAASSLLSLLLPVVLVLAEGGTVGVLVERFLEQYPLGALAASLATLAAVEVRRRSISYEVSEAGVSIKSGVWRRQEQTIPYSSIGRIVMEQSLLGRVFDYGTIIVVSAAEWGAEYYTRAVGVGAGRAPVAVAYARTLKEVSRDPGKCLYGVRRPRAVRDAIESRLRETLGAELEQVRLLRGLRDKLAGADRGS